MSLSSRRNDTVRIIAEDPWTIVVYHRVGNTETKSTLTGRVFPASGRAFAFPSTSERLRGEHEVANAQWVLLTAWDAIELENGDRVEATHVESGIVHHFEVVLSMPYPYKKEILVDERK